jgi:hypothetical protein
MIRLFRFLLGLAMLVPIIVFGQDVNVRGQFLADSIKIGQPFAYALGAKYPSERNALFPDSTYSFAPFEYVGKRFFPTKTVDGVSHDSAIYYFNSFEIDSVQTLRLPVFIVQGRDSTSYWALDDSVWLKHLVTMATDSVEAPRLPLKVNTYYEPVAWLFNYPVASLIVGILVVALVVVWLIFGARIKRYFKARSMRKSFEKYRKNFTDALDFVKSNYSVESAEKAVGIWKKYLENLEGEPITKYTSKEIMRSFGSEGLATPLSIIDRMLYAGAKPSSFDAFYDLKTYSEDRFFKKLEELNMNSH